MYVTKRTLGINYVLGTGIILSVLFVLTLANVQTSPVGTVLGGMGLLAALSVASAGYWLDACEMRGEQVWRVSTHAGLGIGVLTLSNLAVIQMDGTVLLGSPETTVLAGSIAIGGAVGIAVGIVREFDRTRTTLTQSTEVLARALRHNLRNDMTVILGQLDQLETDVSGPATERVRTIRTKIDDVVTLSEKAQQIELAVTGEDRNRHPVDAVAFLRRRIDRIQTTYPNVSVKSELPERAWVSADWMLGIAIENVMETAIENGHGAATFDIEVERTDRSWTSIRIVDVENSLPTAEINAVNSGTETPLEHSRGLGLWLVSWIVESYGGHLEIDNDNEQCVVTIRLRRAIPTQGRKR